MDRIANPWGGRTPFGRGGEWPVRVDQFLEDGVAEDDVDDWVQTASYTPLHEEPGEEYPFRLNTGRTIYYFHTRTKTARAPQFQNAAPQALLVAP